MAKKFLTALDMAQNAINNAQVQNLASAPSSPVKGQVYFDTTLNQFGAYSGSAWTYLGASSGGTVTTLSVVSSNGLAGTVTNPTTTPAITLSTTVTGLVKGNGTALSAASSGTDYSAGTSANATGIVKSTTGTGTLTTAVAGDFPTLNQNTTGTAANVTGTVAIANGGTGSTTQNFVDLSAAQTVAGIKTFSSSPSVPTPVLTGDAANKAYVDSTSQGLSVKPSVAVATAAALPANTYSNGVLTASANAGLTVDGVAVTVGQRVLVQNEATAANNGIYTVTNAGSGSAAYVLTRAVDMNSGTQIPGSFVFVESGTVNGAAGFTVASAGVYTIGTTAIVFTQFSGAGEILAGTGITKTGNTIALATPVSLANGGTGSSTQNFVDLSTSQTIAGVKTFSTAIAVGSGGTGATSLTGLVKGNGASAMTAAVSGTDYAPATATSNILKGNGSGGFTSAKYTATIGDGATAAIAVTHGLGTQDVIAQVRDASTNAVVECDITQTSTTVTTFTFSVAPAASAYKVVIIG